MHQKLIPDRYLVLVTAINKPMHLRNSFGNRQFEKKISKFIKKSNFIVFEPNPLDRNCYETEKVHVIYSENYNW